MADLHRYVIRIQQVRDITIDAQSAQHARTLAEDDVEQAGDTEFVQAQNTTLIQSNVGTENGAPLHRYQVAVRFRRNINIDALDKNDARNLAKDDTNNFPGTQSVQPQSVTFLKEKTGIG